VLSPVHEVDVEPATRSLTVPETSTSPGPATELIRAADGDMDGPTAQVVASHLAFAGVQAQVPVNAQLLGRLGQPEDTPTAPFWQRASLAARGRRLLRLAVTSLSPRPRKCTWAMLV
jgi:hypothetical protein